MAEKAPSSDEIEAPAPKRLLGEVPTDSSEVAEDPEAKRRRILEETRDIDADSDPDESNSSDEDRYAYLPTMP